MAEVDTRPIDWVARWRRLVEERHDQGRRLDREHRRPDAWSGRARRFARFVRETGGDDPLLHRLLATVTPDATVLDVGGGPGRHAIPLARVASQVTVVEPSEAMREVLSENVAQAGLTNLTVVPAEWPAAVEPADLVLCAHVLYPVAEVEPFLRALDAATGRACFVALRLGQREGPYLDLFEQVWGEPRALAPTALDLFSVAHQLGLPASFELVPFPAWRSFIDRDDAREQVRADILNPYGPAVDRALDDFLTARLVERDGRLYLNDDAPRAGIVWWPRG